MRGMEGYILKVGRNYSAWKKSRRNSVVKMMDE